ncbi:MAG: peptidyl-prolyl cis-trans isomerase [Selenomonas sp.]|uniref:peptidylprolyl isomerase n=1 Tax=Selenomonas sp. TaxID=2053611 RepID=UPI0025E9CED4|nr:peptidylprolyl isomerase [Selenomonas sp.]MCR5438321.1 peptidyl-prolyl cis-trans isomerase [Selenomonas sp.]
MSASTERKNRQAAREAGTDKKMLALEKEGKEKARSKRRWTIGTAAVVILIALVLLLNSPLVYRSTAYSVGDRNYSTAEVNYYYANQYHTFANQYGNYASMFGLDTSNGVRGLDKQDCPFTEGSWKDYFLDGARNQMLQNTALLDYAAANGIALDESETAAVDASFTGIDEAAKAYGYGSADKMMAANYGTGVTVRLVRGAYLDSALAGKTLEAAADAFTYTDAQLEEQYAGYNGERDVFTIDYVQVEAHDHDNPESEVTDEMKAEARAKAEAVKAAYEEGLDPVDPQGLDFAAEANGLTATHQTLSGSSLSFAKEWLMDAARKAGDVTVEESGDHIYVVLFLGRDDNHYRTVSVRHILVKAVPSEDGTYSDEAKAEARAKAEEILAEYEAGDKSEESFAALAEQYSEDGGSNTNGGLYEGVYKNQMVAEFNDFCFGPHAKSKGDTAIVYGESSGYAGYHVMYYVGEGDLYSNTLAAQDLRNTDVESWLTGLTDAYATGDGFGMKFVG